MKTVCPTHVYAHEVGQACPWCAPPVAVRGSRLVPYHDYKIMSTLMEYDMMGRWDARLHHDASGTFVLSTDNRFYQVIPERGESLVEAFLGTLQEFRGSVWNDQNPVELARLITEPLRADENWLYDVETQEGYDVGITNQNRFFLSDRQGDVHCNALYLKYIYGNAPKTFFRALVQAVIDDLDLGLTLK
jgi:hypothetical protein